MTCAFVQFKRLGAEGEQIDTLALRGHSCRGRSFTTVTGSKPGIIRYESCHLDGLKYNDTPVRDAGDRRIELVEVALQ